MTTRKPREKLEYHFSTGNSSEGPIGIAGSVVATSRPAAVKKFRRLLREHSSECAVRLFDDQDGYAVVYLNPTNIVEADIDEEQRQ